MSQCIITSKENPIFKGLAALKQKKHRDKAGAFLLEGERLTREVPEAYRLFSIMSESYSHTHPVPEKGRPVILSDRLFSCLSETETPQGFMVKCRKPVYRLEELPTKPEGLYIICERIQDPGNLGTIIRTAAGAGADALFLTKGSVDLYNPKVLRSTAGALFHLPVVEGQALSTIGAYCKARGIALVAALPQGRESLYDRSFLRSTALLVGNEANGLSEEALLLAEHTITIPMPGGIESLNASMACGILIYEAVRQKYKRIKPDTAMQDTGCMEEPL